MWLEGGQVEGEQEGVFVDQGQEQEPFAEGKPFIHCIPIFTYVLLLALFYKFPIMCVLPF